MPNLGVIGELIVKIKAEDAKETGEQIKSVQKTTKDAGQEAKRQVPVLENMGRRWGAVLSLVAASGAVAFGMILKSSPSVMGALKGMQLAFESIFGLLGEELAPIFEWLEEILWKVSEAFENLSPEMKTLIAGFTLGIIIAGILAAAVLAVAAGLPALAAAVGITVGALLVLFAKVIIIVGLVGIAVALLFTAWKYNWGGIQDKTKAALQFIKYVISRVTNWIKGRWDTFLRILFNKNLTTYGKLKALWGFLKETIKQITTAIRKETAKAWEAIKRKSLEIWGAIKIAVPVILNKLKAIMAVIWADIKASAAELWEDIKKIITDKIQAAYDFVIEKFEEMKTALSNTIKHFADNPIVSIIKTIKKTVSSVGSSSVESSSGSSIDAYKAARTAAGTFAKGGDVRSGMPYLVGEAGMEMFVPNVSGTIVPNHKMSTSAGVQSQSSTRPININLDLKLDGRTVWESMRRYSAAEIRRLGG